MELRKQLIQDIEMIPECYLTEISAQIKEILNNQDDIMPPLVEYDREKAIDDAIADRKAGINFITAEESLAELRAILNEGKTNAI